MSYSRVYRGTSYESCYIALTTWYFPTLLRGPGEAAMEREGFYRFTCSRLKVGLVFSLISSCSGNVLQ
jgi:hypothetical protein